MAEYKINYTQSNFTGGIIAAELYGRNDFNKVKTGLKKCTNWTIREAGGLEFRRGTRYLQTIPAAAGTNFKLASLDKQLFFFCNDCVRYLDSNNTWQYLDYPVYNNWNSAKVTNLGNNNHWQAIACGGSVFVALGLFGHVSVSSDGKTWTAATQDTNLGNHGWTGVVYDGTKFVALSSHGYISTSTDGITWTAAVQNANLGDNSWNNIAYGNSKFVALGHNGYISTSTNGTTWTTATQNANLGNGTWEGIVYDGTKFVALRSTGYVSTSTNGTTWTTATQNTNLSNHSWYSIAYDGTRLLALGGTGYISTSNDGTTWTAAVQDTDIANTFWYDIIYDGSKFVAISYLGEIATAKYNNFIINIDSLHFTELNRKLYYYDGINKLSEITLTAGVPATHITSFESAPAGATLTSAVDGTAPTVYVPIEHKYTFSLAKDAAHETVVSSLTTEQTANAELTQADSSEGTGQQVNVTVTLTADQVTEYDGGKVLIYKQYQGYFYFLSALDIDSTKVNPTIYTFEDKGQVSVDMSKTPKESPDYLNSDGSISGVNSIADYNQRLFLTQSGQDVTRIIFSEAGNTESLAYSSQRNDNEAGSLELPISNYDSWCKVTSGLDLILSTSYTISKVSGYGELSTETI